jgi:hypothetical protein
VIACEWCHGARTALAIVANQLSLTFDVYVGNGQVECGRLPRAVNIRGDRWMNVPNVMPSPLLASSQFWGGVLNTHFWLDPAHNLAGLYMTQSIPFLETQVVQAYAAFEAAKHL